MKLHTTALIGGTRRARVLISVLAFLACFAASSSTQAATAPLLSSNRFLFIIDASASMKPLDKNLRETVFDLVYSGMRGQMTNGDTYGVWVVQDKNDTSFTMDTWRAHHAVEMAAKATAHVKDRGFKGNARLDLALADALRVVRNVGDLTIVIVSNGETPVTGTPFDEGINARFRELAPQMKRAKATLNTVLVAQDKALLAWAANGPDFLLEVPRVAPKPKPAKTELVIAKTNAPAAASNLVVKAAAAPTTSASLPPVQKARVASNPIIITKDTVAQERREWMAMTSTATNESVTSEANAVTAAPASTNATAALSNSLAGSVAAPAPSTPTNASANFVTPKTPTVAAAQPAKANEPASSNRAVAVEKSTKPKVIEPVAAEAPLVTLSPMTPVAARTQENRSTSQPLLWASLGGAAAVLCVLIGVFVARSQRREASLISQAIAQQRIHTS